MKIQIREDGAAPKAVRRTHVQRRLQLVLGRFGDLIASVMVRLSSAQPGGIDTASRCDLEVLLRPRSVSATDADKEMNVAVDNAARRLARSVDRALDRERAWHDGQPRPRGTGRREP